MVADVERGEVALRRVLCPLVAVTASLTFVTSPGMGVAATDVTDAHAASVNICTIVNDVDEYHVTDLLGEFVDEHEDLWSALGFLVAVGNDTLCERPELTAHLKLDGWIRSLTNTDPFVHQLPRLTLPQLTAAPVMSVTAPYLGPRLPSGDAEVSWYQFGYVRTVQIGLFGYAARTWTWFKSTSPGSIPPNGRHFTFAPVALGSLYRVCVWIDNTSPPVQPGACWPATA